MRRHSYSEHVQGTQLSFGALAFFALEQSLLFYVCDQNTTFCRRNKLRKRKTLQSVPYRVQELRESRGGCPGFPVLMSLMVSEDVKRQH